MASHFTSCRTQGEQPESETLEGADAQIPISDALALEMFCGSGRTARLWTALAYHGKWGPGFHFQTTVKLYSVRTFLSLKSFSPDPRLPPGDVEGSPPHEHSLVDHILAGPCLVGPLCFRHSARSKADILCLNLASDGCQCVGASLSWTCLSL